MKNELTISFQQPKYTVGGVISAILNEGSDPLTTINEIMSHLKAKSSPGYAEFLRVKAAKDSVPRGLTRIPNFTINNEQRVNSNEQYNSTRQKYWTKVA